jgi:hypothetical protein
VHEVLEYLLLRLVYIGVIAVGLVLRTVAERHLRDDPPR